MRCLHHRGRYAGKVDAGELDMRVVEEAVQTLAASPTETLAGCGMDFALMKKTTADGVGVEFVTALLEVHRSLSISLGRWEFGSTVPRGSHNFVKEF